MTGLPTSHAPTQRVEPTIVAPRVHRRQALLYAPPPTAPAPYITLLEAEGFDVLVANSPESAAILLGNASPAFIIAIVPILGEDLRDLFRKHSPNAEVRVLPGLMAVLEDAVVRPRDAVEFAIRSIAATAGVLAAMRNTPRERTARILQLTEKSAGRRRYPSDCGRGGDQRRGQGDCESRTHSRRRRRCRRAQPSRVASRKRGLQHRRCHRRTRRTREHPPRAPVADHLGNGAGR